MVIKEEIEATQELEAIPGLVERVWDRYNRLVQAGVIQPEGAQPASEPS